MKAIFIISLVTLFLGSCNDMEVPRPHDYIELVTSEKNYLFNIKPENMNANSYYLGNNQDQLTIVMGSKEGIRCDIHLMQTDLLNRTFPFSISNELLIEYGEIQMLDENQLINPSFDENDDVNFIGNSYTGVTIELISFENNILTGRLTGPISTKTGREKTIVLGEFKILIDIKYGN